MSQPEDQSCNSCRFWDKFPKTYGLGQCLRQPPTPLLVQLSPMLIEARYPPTNENQWCGEYVREAQTESANTVSTACGPMPAPEKPLPGRTNPLPPAQRD